MKPAARRALEKPRAGFWKTTLYMLVMGVICTWITALAYPLELKMHIAPAYASRLPGYAFFFGLALGLGIGLSKSMKEIFQALAAMAILGGVFWFFGVLLGGLLIGFNAPDSVASWAPRIGFGAGVLLGSVLLFAIAHDRWAALRRRWQGPKSIAA